MATAHPHEIPPGEHVVVLDFGSQTAQLIARRCRDLGVLTILESPTCPAADLAKRHPMAIILSGGPASVYDDGAPRCDPAIFDLGIPVLGICYGMQLACHLLGGDVRRADHREFGRATLTVPSSTGLLASVPSQTIAWMSHGDQVRALPAGMHPIATTATCPFAAVASDSGRFFGVQFHPEVTHTPHGADVLRNFLFNIAGCHGIWKMAEFVEDEVVRIRKRVGTDRVICGLSGGVDSSVAAALLARAIGPQLTCVFVDNGLLRTNERSLVETTFRDHFAVDLRVVDAEADFLSDLKGIDDPQEKRRRIGHRFVEVFKAEAESVRGAKFLAQGTLYPDVIESGHGHAGASANIKLHHNVGGLPEDLGFELIEPLRTLFKDEVRRLGAVLGLPESIVWRHPFPGPGLAVRVLGEVTRDKLEVLRACDEILLEEITAAGLYRATSQVFAVLLSARSVGVMGDGRTYESVVAIRAVTTEDFMTADWARIPHDVLATISTRIINAVRGVNRVVYDISSKPPATIEWE